jgi:hypothetical protein
MSTMMDEWLKKTTSVDKGLTRPTRLSQILFRRPLVHTRMTSGRLLVDISNLPTSHVDGVQSTSRYPKTGQRGRHHSQSWKQHWTRSGRYPSNQDETGSVLRLR